MPEAQKPSIQFDQKDSNLGSSLKTLKDQTNERFKSIDVILIAVIVALVISAISAFIAVGAIVIDQLHFNNQTYRDTSAENERYIKLQEEIMLLKLEMNNYRSSQSAELSN